jgi:hypothetical protein
MITIKVAAHKRVHRSIAIDAAGRRLGEWRGATNATGRQEVRQWAQELGGPPPRAGVEGTISRGIRTSGLRRTRYTGLARTDPDMLRRM